MIDVARRSILTGAWRHVTPPIRPPWSGDETHFLTQCTRCNRCLQVCESGILQRGQGGWPVVNFHYGECTFCYACAEACSASLFLPRHTRAWDLVVTLGQDCLAQRSVECRRCQDSCEEAAITFRPSLSGIWQPRLNPALCSGCGACLVSCPVAAIEVEYGSGNALAGM